MIEVVIAISGENKQKSALRTSLRVGRGKVLRQMASLLIPGPSPVSCALRAATTGLIFALVAVGALLSWTPTAYADPYTVSDVEVDAKAKDAQAAKLKAISEAQVKAFQEMIQRIASADQAARLSTLDPGKIGRLMSSMSVQKEQTGPGRYIATLTISFLPNKVRQLLETQGVEFSENQAPPTTVVPVWIGRDGAVLWNGDNPWLTAWRSLDLKNTVAPVILPLGDAVDQASITTDQAAVSDPGALSAVAQRYHTDTVLVAAAELVAINVIRVTASGLSAAGPVAFDNTFNITDGNLQQAALAGANAVMSSIQEQWKSTGAQRFQPAVPAQKIKLAVPFTSLAEWNSIRSRLMATSGIQSVDVQSLSGTGAITTLEFKMTMPELQDGLARNGFVLSAVGDTWVLQPRR
ncbi:DUF2066 domain-containing protein [Rhodoligotrophos appendicifer]|uniref:DUF2066 domain-containing protein n=1 Tax=Rhodoligotrophos appendicifer TaxID=987056 RepID=UPI00117E93EF|nr:DUF2066 domain-containing protein [Rhodoligotrophos appendicifer]